MGSRLRVLAKVRVTGQSSCQVSIGRVAHLRLHAVRPKELEWGKPHHLQPPSHCPKPPILSPLTATCCTSAVCPVFRWALRWESGFGKAGGAHHLEMETISVLCRYVWGAVGPQRR